MQVGRFKSFDSAPNVRKGRENLHRAKSEEIKYKITFDHCL